MLAMIAIPRTPDAVLDFWLGPLRGIEAENGVRMQELDKIMMRQSGDLVFWRSYISDIEDVDIGEAIAKLNNDRTALEASTQVVARLSRVSLLDFI